MRSFRRLTVVAIALSSLAAIASSAPVSAQGAPIAPSSCTAVRTGNTIQLDWTRAPDDNAERFVIRRSRNQGTTYWAGITLPPATTFTQTGLSTTSTYQYFVETKSPNLTYSTRTPCEDETPPPAEPVAPSYCSAVRTGNTIQLNWTRSPDDNAERYILRRSRNQGTTYWAGITLPPATTFTQTGLSTTSTYQYFVETKSPNLTYSTRTPCEDETPPPAEPVAPSYCSAVRTGNTIQLNWTRSPDDNAETLHPPTPHETKAPPTGQE